MIIEFSKDKLNKFNSLSTELKICYYIQGWNDETIITTKEQWIDIFWPLFDPFSCYDDPVYINDQEMEKICRQEINNQYDKLYYFYRFMNG